MKKKELKAKLEELTKQNKDLLTSFQEMNSYHIRKSQSFQKDIEEKQSRLLQLSEENLNLKEDNESWKKQYGLDTKKITKLSKVELKKKKAEAFIKKQIKTEKDLFLICKEKNTEIELLKQKLKENEKGCNDTLADLQCMF